MPRPPRIEFNNAWYHVMNRAAARRRIFDSNEERAEFVEILAEVSDEFQVEIHAYCLMDNHFHLLFRTPHGNLNLAMQKLTSLYSRRYNRRRKIDGPLFKGRYKAILIAEESYLVQVSPYIHRNPIEAGMTKTAREYPWSSFKSYAGDVEKPSWLSIFPIIKKYSPLEKVSEYLSFVENPLIASMSEFYNSKRLPGVLGSKEARRLVENKTGYRDTWYPIERPSLSEICVETALCFDIPPNQVTTKVRGIANICKMTAMHAAQTIGRYRISDISNHLGMKPSGISQALTSLRRNYLSRPEVQTALHSLRNKFLCA